VGNVLIGNNVQTTAGTLNTGVGGNSGSSMINGSYNSWFGANALTANKNGGYNVAMGAHAGRDDSLGSNNVYIGAFSGSQVQGSSNVFIGPFAGIADTTVLSGKMIINAQFSKLHLMNGDFGNYRIGIKKELSDLLYTLDIGGEVRIGSLNYYPVGANGVVFYHATENKLKTYENGAWKNTVYDNTIKNKPGDPTTGDVPSGTFHVWKDTNTGLVYLWANDGGTLKKVLLQ
jgi:hypothetical protein